MRIPTMAAVVSLGIVTWTGDGFSQIKPESSGKPSSSEPEPRVHSEGEYRPNEPGQPEVGGISKSGSSTPFENQTHKGSDPSANGK